MEMCVCVCQIGNPLKILTGKGLLNESADADMVKSGKKYHKVREVNRGGYTSCMKATVFAAILESQN